MYFNTKSVVSFKIDLKLLQIKILTQISKLTIGDLLLHRIFSTNTVILKVSAELKTSILIFTLIFFFTN